MTTSSFTVRVEAGELDTLFARIGEAVETEAVLDDSSALLLNRIRTRFLAETDPDGNKWPPSKAGLARRARGGTGTLFDTGRLFRSIQAATINPPGQRAIITDVPYAKAHNDGGGKLFGGGIQVKRTFMGFSDEDALFVEKLILNRIRRIVTDKTKPQSRGP